MDGGGREGGREGRGGLIRRHCERAARHMAPRAMSEHERERADLRADPRRVGAGVRLLERRIEHLVLGHADPEHAVVPRRNHPTTAAGTQRWSVVRRQRPRRSPSHEATLARTSFFFHSSCESFSVIVARWRARTRCARSRRTLLRQLVVLPCGRIPRRAALSLSFRRVVVAPTLPLPRRPRRRGVVVARTYPSARESPGDAPSLEKRCVNCVSSTRAPVASRPTPRGRGERERGE